MPGKPTLPLCVLRQLGKTPKERAFREKRAAPWLCVVAFASA
jgi:hypothetical protein